MTHSQCVFVFVLNVIVSGAPAYDEFHDGDGET